MLEAKSLEIYVDGSVSKENGGVGVRVLAIDLDGNESFYDFQSAGYSNAKSGQVEIIACAYALEEIARSKLLCGKKHAIIFTDSKYVADNHKKAMFHWVGHRWLWWDGRPVLDATEWKQLVKQIQNYRKLGIFVEIKWTEGHSKNKHNDAAHKLAKESAKLPLGLLPRNMIVSAFRPKTAANSSAKFQMGSVKMEGQRISIKVLDVEYLVMHKLWSYKYSVVSKCSPYCGLTDKIFSAISLDAGKTYYVRFNSNTRNPRLEKMYWEARSQRDR